jgi:hypothetical protein
MASRAQVIHDYAPGESSRPRRDVWFRSDDEPVVLPRRDSWSVNLTLIASAVAAAALTVGVTSAVLGSGAPALGPTPTTELTPSWTPDPEPLRAKLFQLSSGPAQAMPTTEQPEAPEAASEQGTTGQRELTGDQVPNTRPAPETSFTIVPPVSPDEPSAPEPAHPEIPASKPYPNPTTTPPEIVPPVDSPPTPELPSTPHDPENPY